MTRQRLQELWASAPADVMVNAYFDELMEAINDAQKSNKESQKAYAKLEKQNALLKLDIADRNGMIVSLRQQLARYKEREKTMGWNQS